MQKLCKHCTYQIEEETSVADVLVPPVITWQHIWPYTERQDALANSYLRCLPNEILIQIFRILSVHDLGNVALVCRTFKMVTDQNEVWSKKYTQENDDKRLVFKCKIAADSKPDLFWSHDDVAIQDSGRYLIYCDPLPNNAYVACLIIDDVNTSDAGKYKTSTKNKLGENQDQGSGGRKTFTQAPQVLPSLVEDHIYEFRATAEKEARKGTPSDATTPIKVKDPNISTTAPEFLRRIKDGKGNENKTITLECEVIETPKSDVEWFKDTKKLSEGANIKVRNKGGSRMCRCNVSIRSLLRFRLPPKYQDILNYDGNDITKDKNVSIDVSDRATTLTIRIGDYYTTGCQLERATRKHESIYDYYDIVEEIGR
ncbi:unnamed protein product [Adineta steineri]|uniref:F-box domain-containing protein n=1 Tax=Adineta steineri TaxID=433720 RepID=A0A818RP83_9BILA|nr:unnamed protein product [Adineta steineri]CAF3661074.1 unnamed protein product [Adineta steineri]